MKILRKYFTKFYKILRKFEENLRNFQIVLRTCRTFSYLENLYELMTEETRPGFLANYKIVRPPPAQVRPGPVDTSSINLSSTVCICKHNTRH